MINLLEIAQTESDGGDLLGVLSSLFQPSDVRLAGYPDALIWQGGLHDGKINPVAQALTDA